MLGRVYWVRSMLSGKILDDGNKSRKLNYPVDGWWWCFAPVYKDNKSAVTLSGPRKIHTEKSSTVNLGNTGIWELFNTENQN